MDVREYIRIKSLLDFYNSLSEDEKRQFSQMKSGGQEKQSFPATVVECKDPYWRGVSQNIVGDAIYDVGLHFLKKLLGRVF